MSTAPSQAADDPAPAPVSDESGPQVYEGVLTPSQLATVRAAGLDFEDVSASPVTGKDGQVEVEVIMPPVLADEVIKAGVPLTLKEVDPPVTATARSFSASAADAPVFRPWSGPGNLEEEVRGIAAAYPSLAQLVVIGHTVQGQEILAVRVTKDATKVKQGKRPAVLYNAAQHAREWITPEMNRRLLRYFLENYKTDREIRRIVDTTELWFVVVANPDGYDYTFTPGNRLWRKNLADNNGDGVITGIDGVDPNRNWPFKWGYDNEGSSPDFASATYRGPAPGSEPETQALDGLMARIDFSYLVNYHSAAELLLYGTGWQVATPTPDDVVYEALAGDDAEPGVPGYDPDLSAELYTTNGETTEHGENVRGVLGFTPEMSTCETASAVDPTDAFEPENCQSVFNFPDSEPLIQAEFEKNIPFALDVAKSAQDPGNPVSHLGNEAADLVIDPFDVSYGSPQTVAVTASRELEDVEVAYRVNGGKVRYADTREWKGGERYGGGGLYYTERRGRIRDIGPGDSVQVWFTGKPERGKARVSDSFTFTVATDASTRRDDVLVVSNEDYNGFNPVYSPALTAPKYAQAYVDAVTAAGARASLWDVTAQGVPHDLGVLSHFDAVIWYQGDNRLTQDAEDVLTDTFAFGPRRDLSVAEREQYLTISVRDYLNDGGKLLRTGETAGYNGELGGPLGGIYYGLDGAPDQDCVVTVDFFSDCLLLADDFFQYYLGAYSRGEQVPEAIVGTRDPLTGLVAALDGTDTNPVDEAGSFTVTSDVLPVEEFPQFASSGTAEYGSTGQDPYGPAEGDWYVGTLHGDDSWTRLTRTIDLTGVTAAQAPALTAQLSYDMEPGYDSVILEARTSGGDDWTTLPEAGGLSSTEVPTECEVGFLLTEHPFLTRYLTGGVPACSPTGTSGSWNALTGNSGGWQPVSFDLSAYAGSVVEVSFAYVTDPNTGGQGVFIDDTAVRIDGAPTSAEGFEAGLGAWSVTGPPAGSPGNSIDFSRSQDLVQAFGAVTTPDTVLFGFGAEQIADEAVRNDLVHRALDYLLGH